MHVTSTYYTIEANQILNLTYLKVVEWTKIKLQRSVETEDSLTETKTERYWVNKKWKKANNLYKENRHRH